MITIALHNIQFTAFHGLHKEEQKIGTRFSVNLEVDYEPSTNSIINHIEQTINYVELYAIVKQRMAKPTPLLETVVQELAQHILQQFAQVKTVRIQLTKLNSPIHSFNGSVSVQYELSQ